MRSAFLIFLLIVLGVAAFVAYNAYYIVHQTQIALVLEFGRPRDVVTTPGLKLKTPFIQTVAFFDNRILDIDLQSKEVIASDQKRLVVDAFARYKIIDALKFFETMRDERRAQERVESVMESTIRGVLGSNTFLDVVKVKRDALMQEIAKRVDGEVKNFGIEIVDVRLKRVDLPAENSQSIYERMKTERQRQAAEIRAQGSEGSKRIKANGDRQVTIIIAEANRDAERLRGEGDAERTRIYADAYGKDADFFAFQRSMQAYEEGLKPDDTRLVISPNSEFFQFFRGPSGGTAAPAPAPPVPGVQGQGGIPPRTSQAGQ